MRFRAVARVYSMDFSLLEGRVMTPGIGALNAGLAAGS